MPRHEEFLGLPLPYDEVPPRPQRVSAGEPMTATNYPLRQLLDPHYEQNLAINKLAMGGLLAQGDTIDTALGGKGAWTLDGARMFYRRWSFKERSLTADLWGRGMERAEILLAAHLIFCAGPQHAAVNNVQFDAYGWVPNSPAVMHAPLPAEPSPE